MSRSHPAIRPLLFCCMMGVSSACGEADVDVRAHQESCSIDVGRIAELGSDADSLSLTQPAVVDVAALSDGGWVLVDPDGAGVVGYTRAGGLRGRLVRPGQGPLEVVGAERAVHGPGDSVWVSRAGRTVVLSPDGEPVRTLAAPARGAFDGHTPGGLPYTVGIRLSEAPGEGRRIAGVAVVMTPDGDSLYAVGPGAVLPDEQDMLRPPVPLMDNQDVAAIDDTAFLAWTWDDPDAWLSRWTPGGEDVVIPMETFREAVDAEAEDARALAIRAAATEEGGAWVLGAVRRLGEEEEAAVREEVAAGLGDTDPAEPFVTHSPRVRNAVFDGVLARVTAEGDISAATVFDAFPRGFADDSHFYALHERENGLLQVHIHRFELSCG